MKPSERNIRTLLLASALALATTLSQADALTDHVLGNRASTPTRTTIQQPPLQSAASTTAQPPLSSTETAKTETEILKPPRWLTQPTSKPEAEDPYKRVWILTVDTAASNWLSSLMIDSASLVAREIDRIFALYDFVALQRKEGLSFRFDRQNIDYVRYFSQWRFSLNGPPAVLAYGLQIVLKNGEHINKGWDRNAPVAGAFPSRLVYRHVESVQLHGMQQDRPTLAKYPRTILAFGWNREAMARARDELLLEAAQHMVNRTFVKWGEAQPLYLPSGKEEVRPKADYTTRTSGNFTSWVETTQGTLRIEANGNVRKFELFHRCSDTINQHTIRGGRFCSDMSHVRVDRWEADPENVFTQFHLGSNGVSFFYPAAPPPVSPAVVDPALLEVGLDTSEPKER